MNPVTITAYAQPDVGLPPDPVNAADLALFEWIMRNIELDDPIALRRNDLQGWAEAAGFEDIDAQNLGEADFWEMRFNRGRNAERTTPAEVERWIGHLARGCRCRVVPGQFVAIVQGNQIAARFRLQPRPQPEHAG